jgi:hypothetical protein
MVYARSFESIFAKAATRMPSAEAFTLRRVTTLETSQNTAEAAASTETDMKGENERKDLQTFRSQQTVSNELMKDSDAMTAVALILGQEIEEHLNAHCVDAVEAISYNPASGGSYRDNVQTGINNGNLTQAAMFRALFGHDVTASNMAAGQRFTAEQRKRLACVMSPTTLEQFILAMPTPNYLPNFPIVSVEETGITSVFGCPIITLDKGILPNATTTKGGLHVAVVDTGAFIIAEQPLLIAVDTESKAENNQSVIHAVYRASAFLTHRSNCTGITLRTMV